MYIDVYRDKANEWRWRFRGGNNETMADSGEGYQNKTDMYRTMEIVCNGWTDEFTYFDVAGVPQVTPVLKRSDGTTISIRDETD